MKNLIITILTILLFIVSMIIYNQKKALKQYQFEYDDAITMQDDNIRTLIIKNTSLANRLRHLQANQDNVTDVKYTYRYNSDTIYLNNADTTHFKAANSNDNQLNDSTYTINERNDSAAFKLTINANRLNWWKLDLNGYGNMAIANNDNGTTTILTDKHTDVSFNSYSKKRDKNFSLGIGLGYGLNTKGEFNPYVGVTLNYNLIRF